LGSSAKLSAQIRKKLVVTTFIKLKQKAIVIRKNPSEHDPKREKVIGRGDSSRYKEKLRKLVRQEHKLEHVTGYGGVTTGGRGC